jgi:NADH-quinone oxidoreductase subunit E
MNELLPQNIIDDFKTKSAAVEHPRELIVDLLRAIQDQNGWVPDAGVELAAEILGLPPIEIEELATFYDKIFRQPVGKRVIHICDSICCWSKGSEETARELQRQLDISLGETTEDGVFTLLTSCCLGVCDVAPAMMIGLTVYGDLTAEKITKTLEQERREVTT